MIYLLSQILLCLALAALLGGAVGWLLHRSRSAARLDELHDALDLRERQLEQAHTDVTMLTDDFDDLRERSRVEIDSLREENRRLPALAENLEKSQLLVRQMMQRHDARTRELAAANATLEERLAQLQERAVAQERALVAANAAAAAAASAGVTTGGSVPPGIRPTSLATDDPDTAAEGGAARRGWASLPVAGSDGGEVVDELMDEVMEVDESLAAELLDDTFDDRGRALERTSGGLDGPTETPAASAAVGVDREDEDDDEDEDEDEDDANATLAIDAFTVEDLRDPPAPPDETTETGSRHARGHERGPDDESASEPDDEDDRTARLLFRPVDRQDDLKRIFGITPVTERALNELGITSYPQLAELERPEIEKIARALEIVPETIERDDWVGNARRQLEDVLEEL